MRKDYTHSYPGRDPAVAFRFYVEVKGIYTAEFLECGALTFERETKQYQEGGINNVVHTLPGRVKQSNIVLKKGMTHDRFLWEWFCAGAYDGKVERHHITIVLGNAELKKVKCWDVLDAYPIKWTGEALNTKSSEIVIETIELAHGGVMLNPEKTDSPNRNEPFGQGS